MSDQSDVPFHMQYDSEDTLASDSGGEQSKPGENAAPATKPKGKSKQGGFFGRGAAQVGKIELDPRISMSLCCYQSQLRVNRNESMLMDPRLCQLFQVRTRARFQGDGGRGREDQRLGQLEADSSADAR